MNHFLNIFPENRVVQITLARFLQRDERRGKNVVKSLIKRELHPKTRLFLQISREKRTSRKNVGKSLIKESITSKNTIVFTGFERETTSRKFYIY
jgi:hypothetical protein